MTKPKSKQPPKNFFRYFVDEYILFRRDFAIDTTASVEECVHQLSQLSYEQSGCLSRQRISASIPQSEMPTVQYFVIKAEDQTRTSYSQTAHAEGYITRLGDGTSFIIGKVLMSGNSSNLIFLVGFIVLLFGILNGMGVPDRRLTPDILKGWFVFVSFGFAFIYNWVRMYLDRNYLMQCIQNAIGIAGMNASRKKDAQITQLYDDSSEPQSHQSKM